MTDHDHNEGNSVVNLDDLDIPQSLRRTHAPQFGTTEAPDGQVELTVGPALELNAEEQDYANEDPEADMPPTLDEMVARAHASVQPSDDIALETLNALPEQEPIVQEVTVAGHEAAPVEALISNAPSQVETVTPSIGHNQPADPEEMKREFFKDINKFGKQSGEGASALGRLGLRALRAAADGIISTAKVAGGKDDATLIYEAYTAMDSKHSEHTAGGAKANASKLRQIIGMGCMTTLSDPVAIGNKVVRIHERMTDQELKPKALFAALVDVAREQQALDVEITDAGIEECLTKTKAEKTVEKEWEAISKRVNDLVTGEASHGLKDQSETAVKIGDMIAEHMKNFKADGTRRERIEQMLEMGYTSAQAEAIVDKKISV